MSQSRIVEKIPASPEKRGKSLETFLEEEGINPQSRPEPDRILREILARIDAPLADKPITLQDIADSDS